MTFPSSRTPSQSPSSTSFAPYAHKHPYLLSYFQALFSPNTKCSLQSQVWIPVLALFISSCVIWANYQLPEFQFPICKQMMILHSTKGFCEDKNILIRRGEKWPKHCMHIWIIKKYYKPDMIYRKHLFPMYRILMHLWHAFTNVRIPEKSSKDRIGEWETME
jgi:hypothetical protein